MNSFLQKVNEGDFFRVVCIGDAQTAQSETLPRWTDWVQKVVNQSLDKPKSWRFQLLNTAANGASPKHIATYLQHYVTQFKPDLVLVSFGHAPLDPLFNESAFIEDFTMLIESLQKLGCKIVVWSPIPLPSGVARDASIAMATFAEQLSKTMPIQYVDVFHEFEGYELSKLFEGDEQGATSARLNKMGNFIVARKLLLELFGLSMPDTDDGDYQVPELNKVRKW